MDMQRNISDGNIRSRTNIPDHESQATLCKKILILQYDDANLYYDFVASGSVVCIHHLIIRRKVTVILSSR
jgi:hypothetical protein